MRCNAYEAHHSNSDPAAASTSIEEPSRIAPMLYKYDHKMKPNNLYDALIFASMRHSTACGIASRSSHDRWDLFHNLSSISISQANFSAAEIVNIFQYSLRSVSNLLYIFRKDSENFLRSRLVQNDCCTVTKRYSGLPVATLVVSVILPMLAALAVALGIKARSIKQQAAAVACGRLLHMCLLGKNNLHRLYRALINAFRLYCSAFALCPSMLH